MAKHEVVANHMNGTTVVSTATILYDFGDNLAAMVKLFGEQVVFEHAKDNMVIALQGRMRSLLKGTTKTAAKRPAEVIEALKDWKPAISNRDPSKKVDNIKKAFGGMTPEQKAALLKELQEQDAPVKQTPVSPTLRKTSTRKAA